MATPTPVTPELEVPREQRRVVKNRGIVKSVLSGDSIVVQSDTQPPQEKVVTLSGLSAPRLSRGPKDEQVPKDEPWAWEAREFVRKAAVGKKITFIVEYTHPNSKREYCTVFLPGVAGEQGPCLNDLILSEGYAKVLQSKKGEGKEAMQQLEEAAERAGKGLHSKDKPPMRPADIDPESYYSKLKGKVIDAVVEQVRTGSSLRVTILPSRHTFQILLSGVQSAGWRKKDGDLTGEPQPEPFAMEAKAFVEQHVLQREVKLTIEGLSPAGQGSDKSGAFSGSIEYNGHDVAEELLKAGFARYIAHSAAPRGQAVVQKMKAAEKFAKDKKLRLFHNYVEPKPSEANGEKALPKEFLGKVTSVLNSGAFLVLPEGSSTEVQINLSSIRLPRPSFPGDEEADAKEEDKKKVEQARVERIWAAEGKEMLRRRLIGNGKVRVVFDYVRQAQKKEGEKPLPEKTFYSVYQGDTNLAVVLVESGLAWVLTARQGEERSMDFEVLIMAETKAKTGHKGLHMPIEKVPPRRYNDLCVDADDAKARLKQIERTKPFLPSFQRGGPMNAIVDYVFSGARFKLTVPKITAIFIFTLAGIRVPKRDESEELSNQALLFARERLHQYEVRIEVNDLDKGGNFIGTLLVNKKDFAVALLENGLASVHLPSAERMKEGKDLIEAEKVAKSKRLNLWKDWDEEEEKKKAEAAEAEASESSAAAVKVGPSGSQELVVTEILDGANFYVQIFGQEAAGLDELVTSLTELSVSEGGGIPIPSTKAGELVRGQFSEDDRWYRAKVLEVQKDGKFKLQYIDYGNVEVVPGPRVRALPVKYHALPAQAQHASLAFIKPLKEDNEYYRDARNYLGKLVSGRKFSAVLEYRDRDSNKAHYTLITEDGYSVAQEMIRVGLARLDRSRFVARRYNSHSQYVKLREEEEKTKSKHVGIWHLGDIPDSDEDEGPSIRPPRGAKAAPAAGAAKEAPKKK